MTDPHEASQLEPQTADATDEPGGDVKALRSSRLMPITTVVNLLMGPGMAIAVLVFIVASFSLIAVRVDLTGFWLVLRSVVPFLLVATAAASLALTIVNRPMRGVEHTVSTLSVLLPWFIFIIIIRPLPLITAGVSVVLCLAALAWARPKKAGQQDGVEAGGYEVPQSVFFGTFVRTTGIVLFVISAAVYVGWIVQAFIDPAGVTGYFGSEAVVEIRLRGGRVADALSLGIAGFYGNFLVGFILLALGAFIVGRATPSAPSTVSESKQTVPVFRSTFFRVVASWFVLNSAFSLFFAVVYGFAYFPIKAFYMLHLALAWIALCAWFFARRGKDGLMILGIFVGVFSLVIVLGIDLAVSLALAFL